MNERGLSLLEALIAVALLGVILASLTPVFLTFLDANTRAEERTGAMAIAQQRLEELRRQEPAGLPDSGSSPLEVVIAGDREFEVVTHYCGKPVYCTPDSRHLLVEVSYGGFEIYAVESVFTTLR